MHRLDRIDQSCSLIPMEASIREGFQEKIECRKKCERAWQCSPYGGARASCGNSPPGSRAWAALS